MDMEPAVKRKIQLIVMLVGLVTIIGGIILWASGTMEEELIPIVVIAVGFVDLVLAWFVFR